MKKSLDVRILSENSPRAVFSQMADIHVQEIPGGFMTTLGTRFLALLYKSISLDPEAFTVAALDGESVRGFLCGSVSTSAVYRRFLLRRGLLAGWVALPRMLSWATIKGILETLCYPMRKHAKSEEPVSNSEVLNFCVCAGHQGQGIGRRVFQVAAKEFDKRGVVGIKIVTGADQKRAQRFYAAAGARRLSVTEVHGGVQSFLFHYPIEPRSEPVKTG